MGRQAAADTGAVPHHIAIIMDGNGRWAKRRGLPRNVGHQRGMEAVRRTVDAAAKAGVGWLTLFGFSSENWRRPPAEINELMRLLAQYLQNEVDKLIDKNVSIRVIGDIEAFDPSITEALRNAERRSRHCGGLCLVLALNYGGRADIARAARHLAHEAAAGTLSPADVDESAVAGRLHTADIPDPDLLVRTSNERRISNFLLWQCAYTEFVYLDVLWPEFDRERLDEAIAEFQGRQRRFGAAAE